LSIGEFVKKHAPNTCEVTLVYNGEVFVSDPYMDGLVSYGQAFQSKNQSKSNFLHCMCFSGKSSSVNYWFPLSTLAI